MDIPTILNSGTNHLPALSQQLKAARMLTETAVKDKRQEEETEE